VVKYVLGRAQAAEEGAAQAVELQREVQVNREGMGASHIQV
jgi:hypothetical protein